MNSRPGVTATTDMAVLPGARGCRPLRRTVQVRKPIPRYRGTSCPVARPSSSRSLRFAQSRKRVPSFVVSRQQFMKYPGLLIGSQNPLGLHGNLGEIESVQVLLPKKQLAS
jgi:hypothetical protein